jgi:hypothetical protein
MKQKPEVVRSKSQINYSYATIRLTQSRIDKGLIAVPVSLAKWFPDHNADIEVYLNDSPISQSRRYSSYSSSTKECRIGGVRRWFEENNLKSGDEIVIQLIDKKRLIYRLIPESNFVAATQKLQNSLDNAASEGEASEKLVRLSEWTNVEKGKVALNEYRRLIVTSVPVERGLTTRKSSRSRESTPPTLRTLLGHLYQGHCQVCDFWFLKRNNEPYFEIHHLDAGGGHHPKNLVVVCGNCHNQFEYAVVAPEFNGEQWLIGVYFNRTPHRVNQIVLTAKMLTFSKELFV